LIAFLAVLALGALVWFLEEGEAEPEELEDPEENLRPRGSVHVLRPEDDDDAA
jgi:hypothetical protein